jgi:hypothetical protein
MKHGSKEAILTAKLRKFLDGTGAIVSEVIQHLNAPAPTRKGGPLVQKRGPPTARAIKTHGEPMTVKELRKALASNKAFASIANGRDEAWNTTIRRIAEAGYIKKLDKKDGSKALYDVGPNS